METYKRLEEGNRDERFIHFMLWAFQNKPGEFIPWPIIVKEAMGYKKPPAQNSIDCKNFKKGCHSARKKLVAEHKKGLIVLRSVGARLSSDKADLVLNNIASAMSRKANAHIVLSDLVKIPKNTDFADDERGRTAKKVFAAARKMVSEDILKIHASVADLPKQLMEGLKDETDPDNKVKK